MKTLVMKFGGASVASPEHFSHIAEIIIARKQKYPRLVIVVSAMGDMTDELIALALKVNPDPPRREYDMLVTVGERISISLLAMALAAKKQEAVSFTGSQSGIITTADHAEAKIVDVKPHRIMKCLDSNKIAIVAGFQGVSANGEITTLGRGGSDTTAAALGAAIHAEKVEFYKDIKGIYNCDPKANPEAYFLKALTYDQAYEAVQKGNHDVLHRRCLELAKRNYLPLAVRSFLETDFSGDAGTLIEDSAGLRPEHPLFEENKIPFFLSSN